MDRLDELEDAGARDADLGGNGDHVVDGGMAIEVSLFNEFIAAAFSVFVRIYDLELLHGVVDGMG